MMSHKKNSSNDALRMERIYKQVKSINRSLSNDYEYLIDNPDLPTALRNNKIEGMKKAYKQLLDILNLPKTYLP